MANQDKELQRERERARFLAEIQRRAEEAELKRIEEEILRLPSGGGRQEEPPLPHGQAPQQASLEKKEMLEKRLAAARASYQNGKYDASLQYLDEVLLADPGNFEATELQRQIDKDKRLLDAMAEEESLKVDDKPKSPFSAQPRPLPREGREKDHAGAEEAPGAVLEPETTSAGPGPAEAAPKREFPAKKIVFGTVILLGATVAYFVYNAVRDSMFPGKPTIAVVPFVAQQPDSTTQMIATSLTEDLIRDLSSMKEVRVMGAATSFHYRGSPEQVLEIGRTLGVKYVVHGTVSTTKEKVTFRLALLDTATTSPVLSREWNAQFPRFQALRSDAARALVDAMQVRLAGAELVMSDRALSATPEALVPFLEGRQFMRNQEIGSLAMAEKAFQRAISLDPKFADAVIALGWTHLLIAESEQDSATRHLALASAALQQATDLGANSPEFFQLWGVIEFSRVKYKNALFRLEQSVELSSGNAESRRRLALLYAAVGRSDDALKQAQAAVELDPLDKKCRHTLGTIHQLRGEVTEAFRQYAIAAPLYGDSLHYQSGLYADALVYVHQEQRAADIQRTQTDRMPDSYAQLYKLGRVYQVIGRPQQQWEGVLQKAKASIENALTAGHNVPVALTYLGLVETRLGRFTEALAAGDSALRLAPGDPQVLFGVARIYGLQEGKTEDALRHLKKAVNSGFDIERILDMDFYKLRLDSDFRRAVTRRE